MCAFLALPALAAPIPFSDIYFFGDSLSDTGNVYTLSQGFFPGDPYFSGRFSNGPVWSEQFATLVGNPDSAKPAGMDLGPFYRNAEVPGTGNNYSIAGAETGFGGTASSFLIPSGLFWQTNFYLEEANGVADSNALYVLFGGGNDIFEAAELPEADRNARVISAAGFVTASMNRLANAGARNFLVLNAPNIGYTPNQIAEGTTAEATAATQAYNGWLNFFLTSLAPSGTNIYTFDVYSAFELLIADANSGGFQFGLTNPDVPCFAGFAGSPGADCNVSIFADDIHPTTLVHQYLALGALLSLESQLPASGLRTAAQVPEPSTSALIAFGLVGLALVSRRRP